MGDCGKLWLWRSKTSHTAISTPTLCPSGISKEIALEMDLLPMQKIRSQMNP
jgi:hypothetical protein